MDSPAIRLSNRLAASPWFGRFMPEPLLPHTISCTAPSASLRFLPLVGGALLRLRHAEYSLCMERLVFRAKTVRLTVMCAASVMAILTLALGRLLWRCARARHQDLQNRFSRIFQKNIEEMAVLKSKVHEKEDDERYLRRRVPFISWKDLQDLQPEHLLGYGGFGLVKKVTY